MSADSVAPVIRDSTGADGPGLAACVAAVAAERLWLGTTTGFTAAQTGEFIADIHARGGIQVLALDADTVIGWCDIFRLPPPGTGHVGRLGMGLLPDWRGQGLGRRLLDACMARASMHRIRRVELEVFPRNLAAIALYEHYGFRREGRKRGAWLVDGRMEDVIVYAHVRGEVLDNGGA